ncbi:hypothetical protein BV22DRAFT_883243 [Leucogyrophana mollusca]|uniref:Uncharacterized protein n=1 Tax=Leucogyrophana mollusca TaxID=85980 RepID=A0ACB8B1C4_9AGAM|nr:hypothetical protein BV22DRAFT_883243 [Leucogyrophana mollusca]
MQKVRTLSFGQPDSRLRSLSITTSPFGAESLSSFNLGWTHLTELKVVLSNGTHLDGHVFLRILQLCPNLVQLTFIAVSVTRNEVADMGIADHLLHARLQVMDIVVLYGIGILLDALTLPQLRTLGISHLIPGSQFWPHTQFKTLLSRSQCPLGSLTVKGAKITPGHHAEYVQVAPSLKNLHSGIGY